MALTRNTTTIAKQTTGDSTIFVTGSSASPNKVLKWDSSGNAVSSDFEMTNESFGGANPSSSNKIPTQESVNALINNRLGTLDGSQLGEIKIGPAGTPSGAGGLAISSKVNGEQTITYTPPEFLTAEQINNAGYDSGEFAEFNADGNLVTSNLKKSLQINAASGDLSLPTTKTVYTYGQNISADRLLGVDDTINHGDFLSYNSATGGFETTAASISNHKLFSANHTDVATSINPSYGDSIYYDGNEWTTGNFGNFGADMEYKGITSQNGATFSELTYSDMNDSVRTLYGRASNGLDAALGGSQVNNPSSATNLSGNFSGLKLTSISNDDGNPIIYNDTTYTISGKVQFPISGLVGTGLVNSKIRGLYIKSQVFMHASTHGNDREAEMYVTYPDGSKQPLLRTDKEPYTEGSNSTYIEQTVFVPVNEGQTQVEIEFNLDKSTGEGFGFEIIGAMCTKRVELSPEVDYIHIVGSHGLDSTTYLNDTSLDGYVDVNSTSLVAPGYPPHNDETTPRSDIWSSQTPTTAPSDNWSDVLPITIPDNVSKTILKSKNAWGGQGGSEEHSSTEIEIDWNEQTITGTYFTDQEHGQSGYLYSDNLTGVKQFTITDRGSFRPIIKIEISGRDIIKLPVVQHRNTEYTAAGGSTTLAENFPWSNYSISYTIENYKTIAPTTKRLGTGFTILATSQLATVASPISGTVDTDGYLIVTAKFTGSAEDDFTVDIAGTVFENNNDGNSQNLPFRETLTLPIAASETYSIASNEGTTFDVRFKAKTLEASGLNGADGAPGATGPQGPAGADSTVPGPAGATGATGATGETGPAGPQGPIGAQGQRGPQGIQGPIGAQGQRGLQGEKGQRGLTGAQGPQGIQGEIGPAGAVGAVGPRGTLSIGSETILSEGTRTATSDMFVVLFSKTTKGFRYGNFEASSEGSVELVLNGHTYLCKVDADEVGERSAKTTTISLFIKSGETYKLTYGDDIESADFQKAIARNIG